MTKNVEAKNILVSGVSRGLGLVIAETLLKSGYRVYGISRSKSDGLKSLAEQFEGMLHFFPFDLADSEAVETQLFREFLTLDIPLHGFVNNAALAYDDIVTNLNLDALQRMYAVNVFSPMMVCKQVIRNALLHRKGAAIVHLSSISVHTGYKGLAMYASSKGALEAFSKNTAREWGTRGIRSNCLVAGFMETDMSATLDDDQKNRIYRRTALKRATETGSVAETVAFLLSEKAASITGQNIFVDSGTI